MSNVQSPAGGRRTARTSPSTEMGAEQKRVAADEHRLSREEEAAYRALSQEV